MSAERFKAGEVVWCRTASNGFVRRIVVCEQLSEGPGPRWPAVRVRREGQAVSESFNWPREDVSHTPPPLVADMQNDLGVVIESLRSRAIEETPETGGDDG